MLTDFLQVSGEEDYLTLNSPFGDLPVVSSRKTSGQSILTRDSMRRRLMVFYQEQPLLHVKLASLFSNLNPKNIRGLRQIFDSNQIYVDYLNQGSFNTTKFEDIYDDKADLTKFENKLVLIGDNLGLKTTDHTTSPFSTGPNMTILELHANMFDTLIRNSAPIRLPNWADVVLTFLIAAGTIIISFTIRPAKGIFLLLCVAAGFTAFAWWTFNFYGLWVEISHPALAIVACYYFIMPYRLIVENRRSWEYYQKHKLLQQVEEMKTNFISMISHDLKTPIARIQGMASIISKDKTIISSPQQEALDTIRASSAELLSTINSILSYARIENQKIELNYLAKDINELLHEVIHRHEFLARVKHVKVVVEFEPLFSIFVDPELIKQAFSNLLENAIKYSSESSSIRITTREDRGVVTVQFIDTGQGIPPEDLPNVFSKFFRGKLAKTSPIKGSGLGLYLAKYLIELHHGQIFIESVYGKGSTFTVQLPTQMKTR